jgi:hypothetical protein
MCRGEPEKVIWHSHESGLNTIIIPSQTRTKVCQNRTVSPTLNKKKACISLTANGLFFRVVEMKLLDDPAKGSAMGMDY